MLSTAMMLELSPIEIDDQGRFRKITSCADGSFCKDMLSINKATRSSQFEIRRDINAVIEFDSDDIVGAQKDAPVGLDLHGTWYLNEVS